MMKLLFTGPILLLLCCTLVTAAAASELQVAEAVLTTAVVNRMPVDTVQAYPADGARLYCFTRVLGADEETIVSHAWYQDGREIGRALLAVRSPNWRTWSVRTFGVDAVGEWRVDILDEQGKVLASVPFTLTGR